jgi:hypothetical protein
MPRSNSSSPDLSFLPFLSNQFKHLICLIFYPVRSITGWKIRQLKQLS